MDCDETVHFSVCASGADQRDAVLARHAIRSFGLLVFAGPWRTCSGRGPCGRDSRALADPPAGHPVVPRRGPDESSQFRPGPPAAHSKPRVRTVFERFAFEAAAVPAHGAQGSVAIDARPRATSPPLLSQWT
eukprot:scaffold16966_cov131-Isochrysis_galbana.AAC.4